MAQLRNEKDLETIADVVYFMLGGPPTVSVFPRRPVQSSVRINVFKTSKRDIYAS